MKLLIVILGLMFLAAPAMAEQQVYTPQQLMGGQSGQGQSQPSEMYYTPPKQGERRVYPGREIYGEKYGPLSRHPGDYKDAVSRGSWDASPRPSPYGIFSLR